MNLYSKHLEAAVEQLASLPSIGKRSALRLALHLLKRDQESIERFAQSFVTMKKELKFCQSCGNISDLILCEICSNPKRDHSTVCVVEDIRDVMAIESTGVYKGVYHVLGALISPLDGIAPSDLFVQSLFEKAKKNELTEVILALNASMEGDTTQFYLYKKLQVFSLRISTLSRGVAVGTELHYADELTLGRSIQNRTDFSLSGTKSN